MAEAAINLMLECPICQEQFSEPRVLPCQHTFCRHCLEKIREHQSTIESIPCPLCRATYHLTTNDIDDLPKNIFAANLIDIVRQGELKGQTRSGTTNAENRQLCTLDTDECSQPATVYCDVCDVNMCEQCELFHKKSKFTRKHQTMAVTKRHKQPYCSKHTPEQLDIFCEDCSLMICSSCVFTAHKDHKYRELGEKMEDFSVQLDHVLTQTDQSLKAIHKAIKVTQKQAVKVKADVTKIKKQTSAAYRAIQRYVEEQEERHLASIDEYYQQTEKVIAETLDEQETLEAVLHSIQLYGQHLSKGSAYDLTTNLRSLVKKSEEEVSKSVPELRWKVDLTWSDWEIKSDVDRVRLVTEGEANIESDQNLTTVTGQSVTRGDRGIRQLNTFTTQCSNVISGVVLYHSLLFIVHRCHDILYVYDERGIIKKTLQIQNHKYKMTSPEGICIVQGRKDTQRLAISDHNGMCLWWLTTEKQAGDVKLGQPQQHKLQYCPCGVSTGRSGRAVVTDNGNRCIYTYSHHGLHATCLQLSRGINVLHAVTDQSDGYMVRHEYSGQLLWINSAGQVTRHYADQPAVRPRHIVDDGTDLLVSDLDNHCVHIVTREGRHDGHLITDIDPTCVCLDPAGRRLWVAYKGKDDKKYVMEMSYTPQSSAVTSPMTSALNSSVCSLTLKVNLPKM